MISPEVSNLDHPTPAAPLLPVLERLEATLGCNGLPRQYRELGQDLLRRLRKPVQLVVVGLLGSGKSTVIDMLLGRCVIGHSPAAGLTEVCYGPIERAELFYGSAEGSREEQRQVSHPGVLAAISSAQSSVQSAPLRQRQELPDPRLRGLNIAEITLSGSATEQAAILEQAVQFGDMILWCSAGFTAEEQALWATVPDACKDHAFLIVTKADALIAEGALPLVLDRLAPVAAEDFLGLYPLAAVQGLDAQQTRQNANAPTRALTGAPTGIDRDLWHRSGGKRLYDDVMQHIDTGRTTDIELAEALVAAFGDQIPPATTSAPATAPAPANPAGDISPTPHSPEDLLAAAAKKISARASDLLPADADRNLDQVLQGALDCVRQLSADLGDLDSRNPKIRAAQEAAQDGEEVLMLCQIEQDAEAATDAVTLLLQLKRELAPG